MDVTVAILAGGRGSRIGGDKALVQLGGRPLISYPLAAAKAAGLDAVVVAKRNTKLPPLDVPVLLEPDAPTPSPPWRHHRTRRAPGRDRTPLRHAVRARRGPGRLGGDSGRPGDVMAGPAVPVPLQARGPSRATRGAECESVDEVNAGALVACAWRWPHRPMTQLKPASTRPKTSRRQRNASELVDPLSRRQELLDRGTRATGDPAGERRGGTLRGVRGGTGKRQQLLSLLWRGRLHTELPRERLNPLVPGHGA